LQLRLTQNTHEQENGANRSCKTQEGRLNPTPKFAA
jgi:hypothetical protein